MKPVKLLIILAAITVPIISCVKKTTHPVYVDTKVEKKQLDLDKLTSAIQYEIEILPDSGDTIYNHLKLWYSINNYKSVWIQSLENTCKIDTLLTYISLVENHGLNPDQFNIDSIFSITKKTKNQEFTYLQLAKMEVKASLAYIKYCEGMKYGFVNPISDSTNYHYAFQKPDSAFVDSCFAATNYKLKHFLDSIQPHSDIYLALQLEKSKLLPFLDSTSIQIPQLPDKTTIKFGVFHEYIPLIARRLMVTGELPFDPDYEINYTTFDDNLLNALNIFRYKNNLLQDREIGNKTIKTLNIAFSEYIDKINVNLERLRWKPIITLGAKYIRVNVADMTLMAFRNDSNTLNMKVCVGKPPKNKTPFLLSKIHELVVNPTWTVPNSIIIKEFSKICVKDTGYLRRHSIHVYKYGEEVNPTSVTWSKLTKKYQPYLMVQDSGDINSLGRLKFNFYNKYSVYLHDTNAKSTFRKHYRAVSHGCVRVEKPLDLAFFCLPDTTTNTLELEKLDLLKDKISYSMDMPVTSKIGKYTLLTNPTKMKLRKVALKSTIPIILNYQTCILNDENEITYTDDIYDLDTEISTQLKSIKL